MTHWFARLCSFGMVLLFAAPTSAQKPTEPPARTAAALADYRKSCASLIGPATSEADNEFLYGRDDAGSIYPSGQYRGLRNVEAMQIRVRNATQEAVQYGQPRHRLARCAVEVALRHALYGVPGYDHGVSSSRPSAPASRPNVAAKATVSASAPNVPESAQRARDKTLEAELKREFDLLEVQYPGMEPCSWRAPDSAIQHPCVKRNSENLVKEADAMLRAIERRQSKASPGYFSEAARRWRHHREEGLKRCARLAATTTPCDAKMLDDGVRQPQLSQKSKTKAGCPANNMTCPPPKGSEVRHILKLGSQCIDAKLLYTENYNNSVDIELANNCTTAQVIATYVETAGFPHARQTYIHGPPYFDWFGKTFPVLNFRPVEPFPITMYPGQKLSISAQGGKVSTVKTAACDYTGPKKVFNRLYTDLTLHGFDQFACVPNPEPPPKPRWPL